MKGSFTSQMKRNYFRNLERHGRANLIDKSPDVVIVHDPQPLGLSHYLKQPGQTWLWRCHIDIEEAALGANHGVWDFITDSTVRYDAVIFPPAERRQNGKH